METATTPSHPTDAPYDARLIARYNTYTFYPTTAEKQNARFAAWATRVRQSVASRLARFGVAEIPADVEAAIANLRRAEVEYMYRTVRARELAPGAYIVGPSNYLKRARPQKAEKCLEIGMATVEAAEARLWRVVNRHSPKRAISSDDPEAIAKLEDKVEEAEARQALMLAANKIVRSKGSDEEKTVRLMALGMSEQTARLTMEPDCCNVVGFPGWELTNNTANIRRMKERIIALSRRRAEIDARAEFDGGYVRDNVSANRIQIHFNARPEISMRDRLKRHSFKWAPSVGAWQRMRNAQTRRIAAEALVADLQWIEAEALTEQRATETEEEAAESLPISPNADLFTEEATR